MKYRDCIVAWTPSYGPYDHLETVGGIAVGPHHPALLPAER